MSPERSFDEDVAFLRRFTDVLVARNADGAALAIVPAWQGRVATSVAGGGDRPGFGFLNDARIASGVVDPQINILGGEDRIWIGPEGSRYSVYFDPGVPPTFAHWRVPPCIDMEPWDLSDGQKIGGAHSARASSASTAFTFRRTAEVRNRAGTLYHLGFERTVRLLDRAETVRRFGPEAATVSAVAYLTENRLTNLGREPFTEASGAPSLWIIGMYKAGPRTVAAVPLRPVCGGSAVPDGVTDDYFGRVPSDRLRIDPDAVFFRADGGLRSKIGVGPARSLGRAAAYDPDRSALTIVNYDPPAASPPPPYVNSLWKDDVPPFAGDAINAYNDGPNESGASFGAFFELETSSPALFLSPGDSALHVHATLHATGPAAALDPLSHAALGLSLARFTTALSTPGSLPR